MSNYIMHNGTFISEMASNKAYIAAMDRKMSTLSPEKLRRVEQSFGENIRESLTKNNSR